MRRGCFLVKKAMENGEKLERGEKKEGGVLEKEWALGILHGGTGR